MDLNTNDHMYKVDDFNECSTLNINDVNNRLVCTFTKLEDLDELVEDIKSRYKVIYNKIFVLYIKSNDEYACTYNIDQNNVGSLPENSILLHRKKDFNTLYSLNGLNEIIKTLNDGVVDTSFPINWQHYRNSIILTQENQLKVLKTKIHKILEV